MNPKPFGPGRGRAARRKFARGVKAVQTAKMLHQDGGVGMVFMLTAAAVLS